jgi:hypothetical protein
MIHQDDIDKKDFSIALPGVTHKISAVSNALLLELNEGGEPPLEVLQGWHLILSEIIEDLSAINRTLYGS